MQSSPLSRKARIRTPGMRVLDELSPATNNCFNLFGKQIEHAEISAVYNTYNISIEFEESEGVVRLYIYFYNPGKVMPARAEGIFEITECFDSAEFELINEFLKTRWPSNEPRFIERVNSQFEEFVRACNALASPVKPRTLDFEASSSVHYKEKFTLQLDALRDYLGIRKTEIFFTTAGYQLRLEDFAKLLVGICKGRFPERSKSIVYGLSNRYINHRSQLHEFYKKIDPAEAAALTKTFVITIINNKDCPYGDVHPEIVKAFANSGGDTDAVTHAAAGAGSANVFFNITIDRGVTLERIRAGDLNRTIKDITSMLEVSSFAM